MHFVCAFILTLLPRLFNTNFKINKICRTPNHSRMRQLLIFYVYSSKLLLQAKILKSLNRSLQKYVPDDVERQKFIVAAYNSGIAHVYDAIALAQKYGKNPQLWDGNVAETILMKSKPEFYNDSVCKYGYFRGKQTVTYVTQVMNFYEKSKKEIK